MDDLTAFIAARLGEDEAALAADAQDDGPRFLDADHQTERLLDRFAGEDRVLREIAAKRAILANHQPYDCMEPASLRCYRCTSNRAYLSGAAIHEAWPCPTMRHLAAVYSDHQDYRQEWKQ